MELGGPSAAGCRLPMRKPGGLHARNGADRIVPDATSSAGGSATRSRSRPSTICKSPTSTSSGPLCPRRMRPQKAAQKAAHLRRRIKRSNPPRRIARSRKMNRKSLPRHGLLRLSASRCFWTQIYPATRLGFEPRMREPKSLVLPLHHRVVARRAGRCLAAAVGPARIAPQASPGCQYGGLVAADHPVTSHLSPGHPVTLSALHLVIL
jgi:hypothetical protein